MPEDVQVILFSLLWLGILDGKKQDLFSFQYDLNEQKQDKDVAQFLRETLEAETFEKLLHNVESQKERVLRLWKSRKREG